ncbi:MAG TPA: DUF3352 domain-containing protein [Solirubrobacteraceae bacterium]|nr:DUF3352 domain-containing protein [Solirubrobacteraceae bacterium]
MLSARRESRIVRALASVLAALAMVVAVAACGSSFNRSTADPAAAVPASVPIYASVQVPDSGQLSRLHAIVTQLGGSGAWSTLGAHLDRMLAGHQVNINRDIAPWIGSSVAVAAMPDPSGAATGHMFHPVLILPTNDMSAAITFVKRVIAKAPKLTYHRDGADLLVGDLSGINAILQGSGSLAGSPGFAATEHGVAGDQAQVYVNVHDLVGVARRYLSRQHSPAAQRLLTKLGALPADAAIALGAGVTSAKTLAVDISSHALPGSGASGTGASVASLPADSIVAAAVDLTSHPSAIEISQLLAHIDAHAAAHLGHGAKLARFEGQAMSALDALRALGPLRLSLGGSSLLTLHGGLTMTSPSPAAAASLVAELYGLARAGTRHGSPLSLTGNATGFSVGAGPFQVHVSDRAGKILALVNQPSAGGLFHSSSTLGATPAYKAALAQLPAGTTSVPVYVSFARLSALLSFFAASAHGHRAQQAMRLLTQLNYLIVGSAPTDTRIVLGLK